MSRETIRRILLADEAKADQTMYQVFYLGSGSEFSNALRSSDPDAKIVSALSGPSYSVLTSLTKDQLHDLEGVRGVDILPNKMTGEAEATRKCKKCGKTFDPETSPEMNKCDDCVAQEISDAEHALGVEAETTQAARDFISKEISHLIKDKGYDQQRAIAAAHAIARKKGYKVPEA